MTVAVPEHDHVSPTTRPSRPRRLRRVVASVGLGLFVVAFAAGCSPAEMRAWWDSQGVDHSHLTTDQQVQPYADAATAFWGAWYAEQLDLAKFDHVLSDEQLQRLRWCETGDNYSAVGGSGSYAGAYRGAYMFLRSTWDSVARQHFPAYVGVDPAAASPRVQDSMARALWSMTGPRSWPVCGYRV